MSDFTLVVRIDLNSNADEGEWLDTLRDNIERWDNSTYRQLERITVTVERPQLAWPT